MGIKDLLRFMKPHIEPINIRKYAGNRVGIDAYSWLHKGAYSCNMEICLDSDGDKKLRYLDYFMHRINLLLHYEIVPVVVFDGGNLPCKAATEQERNRRRQANRDLAMEKLKEGNIRAASEFFQRAVSVTPNMAHQLIQILKARSVEFVVAPYEADAQLAYLSSLETEKGGISAVITEDSDLMAYGCKAIVFKMDRYGNGEEMVLEKVFNSAALTPSFKNFDQELFTGMCVLAGCDFLPSIPGIGIAKAYNLVSKYRNLDRVLSVLKREKGNQMLEGYPEFFKEAMAVFQHAQIYDTEAKKLKHLKPLSPEYLQSIDDKLGFLGPEIPSSIAKLIAEGNLDPVTHEAFGDLKSPVCQPKAVKTKIKDPVKRSEDYGSPARKRCFAVFSQSITKRIMADKKQEAVSNLKYSTEVSELEKLILPSEVPETMDSRVVLEDMRSKVPDNNPFKRKNTDEINFFPPEKVTEQLSVVQEVEYLDMPLEMPEKFPPKSPDKPSRKRKTTETTSEQRESITEQVSEVTQANSSDIVCVNGSQQSVNSLPGRVSGRKRKGGNREQKSIRSKSPMKKRNSILNFFSRV